MHTLIRWAAPGFIVALTGCGSPHASVPATPTARRLARILAARSYTADRTLQETMPDGTHLYIVHSICTGSADGHCQAIDVFTARSNRPIWHRSYLTVESIRLLPHGFSVRSASYAPRDPLCCPNRPPIVTTYTWTGKGFTSGSPSRSAP